MTILHDPGNDHVIEAIWMIVSRDEDGNEGVVSVPLKGTQFPLIASDEDRLEQIKKLAKVAKEKMGIDKDLVLLRFDNREEIEVVA
mgnify:CR=1 FL=1